MASQILHDLTPAYFGLLHPYRNVEEVVHFAAFLVVMRQDCYFQGRFGSSRSVPMPDHQCLG
jgi:hypothetical protein